MLAHYLALGLKPDAGDEEIRKRYLSLIRRYTPEKDPERFQAVSAAYERIQHETARIHSDLFGPMETADARQTLLALIRAASPEKRRVGLQTLLEAVDKKAAEGAAPPPSAAVDDPNKERL
jgi:curved DNA-binding protein CbpA